MHELRIHAVRLAWHAQLVEADHRLALVEQSHHDLLTEHRGNAGDANVERTAVDRGRELSVLGCPLLDDVHAAHDLETADERVVGAHRQLHGLDQLAVDPESDPHVLVEWLDVDVAGPVAQRLADDAVHELDDGCLVVEVDLVGVFGALDLGVRRLEGGDQASDVGIRAPDLLDERLHRLGVGRHPFEALAGSCLRLVATYLGRIGREHDELAVLLADRDEEELASQSLVDALRELGVDLGGTRVAERDATCRGQRTGVLGPPDAVPGEKQDPELRQVTIGLLERCCQPLTVEVAGLHEALAERHTFLDAAPRWLLRRGARRRQRASLVCLRLS
jgi:hypothetical protein